MSEPGNGSDRYAMRRKFAKIGRSRRNLVPALLADPIRASENHILPGPMVEEQKELINVGIPNAAMVEYEREHAKQ